MRPERGHGEMEDDVAAYVLGASEPEEAEAIRRHLQDCAGCRRLAARLEAATSVLALTAPDLAPPPALKQRVLAAAREGRAGGISRAEAPAPPARPAGPSPRPARGWAWPWPAAPRWAPAALAVLVLALLGWNGYLTSRLAAHPAPPAAALTLTGKGALAGASASVVGLASGNAELVEFQDLPAPAPGRVYQLWLIPGAGSPRSAAVFTPQPDGRALVLVGVPLAPYRLLGVTLEPSPDGSPQPTSAPQMTGRIA